ncbi:CYFA0S01e00760g1_1 [Cyberlindnera fabianii]|uniref:Autophagy-related protein 33 n=1 Tax=Cyberlindnera fabianii TaxID=36022 RepID=A0A061ALZ3_CYBFA|nr:Autophagy-related protein 33 [Cyberlindnera fabianii]CDR36352.1 CYFA0S01e00760g1_1 [Cyberlindnera fabianii]
MGTCLAVIKVIGTTSLGLFAGTVVTMTSGSEILKHVLLSSSGSVTLSDQSYGLVKKQITWFGAVLAALGTISTTAFQLAYTSAPRSMKHPYLIYASLVFPVSAGVYYGISGRALKNWYGFKGLLQEQGKKKKQDEDAVVQKKADKKQVVSDLDNSIYKDLGETSADEAANAEDEEIEAEVEAHLNERSAIDALNKVQLGNKIVSALSTLGFVVATIGIYGDF